MQKLFKKILILLVICFLLDRGIGYLIDTGARQYAYDNRPGQILEGEMEFELLILGSSRAAYGYRASLIGDSLGMPAYNLGFAGSHIEFHRDVLKMYLDHNKKPKIIVLNIDEPFHFMEKEGYTYRTDFFMPFMADSFVRKCVVANSDKNGLLCEISSSYRQNENFFNALKFLLGGKEIADDNSLLRPDGSTSFGVAAIKPLEFKERSVVHNVENEEETRVQAFAEVMEICSSNSIQVVCVLPPEYRKVVPGFKDRLIELLPQGVSLLDCSSQIVDKSCFFDNGHLNDKGSLIFSKKLSGELKGLIVD